MKIISSILVLLFLYACIENVDDDKEVEEIIESMEQEHIDWPSLADSPWPMHKHDPQGTNRSHLYSILPDTVTRYFQVQSVFSSNGIMGAVIGEDSTIYFSTSYEKTDTNQAQNAYLYAITPQCEIKWRRLLGWQESSNMPLVRADGSIIYPAVRDVYAFSSYGDLLWKYGTEWPSELNIGIDGTIYFSDNSGLIALNPDGSLLWKIEDIDFYWTGGSISPDGSTFYISGYRTDKMIYAIDAQSGEINWIYTSDDSTMASSAKPIVDNQGNIYVSIGRSYYSSGDETRYLVCVSPEGEEKWRNNHVIGGNERISMNHDGQLVLGILGEIFQLYYSGQVMWTAEHHNSYLPMVVDNGGTVHSFGARDYRAFSTLDGSILSEYEFDPQMIQYPIIGHNGIWFSTSYYGGENKIHYFE